MHPPFVLKRQLCAGDEVDPRPVRSSTCLLDPLECVVIGEGEGAQTQVTAISTRAEGVSDPSEAVECVWRSTAI